MPSNPRDGEEGSAVGEDVMRSDAGDLTEGGVRGRRLGGEEDELETEEEVERDRLSVRVGGVGGAADGVGRRAEVVGRAAVHDIQVEWERRCWSSQGRRRDESLVRVGCDKWVWFRALRRQHRRFADVGGFDRSIIAERSCVASW